MRTREIKFRVFFDNEMIYWNDHVQKKQFYVAPTNGNPCIVFYRDPTHEPHFIGEGRMTAFMQFTGLLDKNGKEIYEGDIVEVNMGMSQGGFYSTGEYEPPREIKYLRTVRWIDEECKLDWDGSHSGSMLCTGNCKYFEVIGNIHQNPELLNVK